MIIQVSEFNEIIKNAKLVKDHVVTIFQGYMYSVDGSTMSILKRIKVNVNPSYNFSLNATNISKDFLASITDTEVVLDFQNNCIYCENNKSNMTYDVLLPFVDNRPVVLYNNIISEFNNGCISLYTNLKQYESFNNVLENKSKDGASLFKLDRYMMYMYSGLIPVNKSDSVDLSISDLYTYFLSKFTVYKKKTEPIDIFIRYLKLDRSL